MMVGQQADTMANPEHLAKLKEGGEAGINGEESMRRLSLPFQRLISDLKASDARPK
jgi:hypothetical protein